MAELAGHGGTVLLQPFPFESFNTIWLDPAYAVVRRWEAFAKRRMATITPKAYGSSKATGMRVVAPGVVTWWALIFAYVDSAGMLSPGGPYWFGSKQTSVRLYRNESLEYLKGDGWIESMDRVLDVNRVATAKILVRLNGVLATDTP